MSRRIMYAIALFAFSALSCRLLAAQSAPAAQIDWSAEDSSRVAWLEQHGRTLAGRHAIVVAPADSLGDVWHRALTDSLDRGVAALRRLMGGTYPWQ
ncbi:MAG: hypothetical protein ABI601_10210, partial [bacterium]